MKQKTQWKRKCPKCNKPIYHCCKSAKIEAEKNNRKCQRCGCAWNRGQTKENNKSIKQMSIVVSKTWKQKFSNGYIVWNKGLTKETSNILKRMGEKHTGFKHTKKTKNYIRQCSLDFWKDEKYRNLVSSQIKKNRSVEKWFDTMVKRGYFIDRTAKSKLKRYYELCWQYTRKNKLSTLKNHKKRGRAGIIGAYHLDHKFSILKGFINSIDAKIIGSINNLEFIPYKQNIIKNSKCSITEKKLIKLYEKENKIL